MPSANVRYPPPLTRLNPFYPGQPGVPGTDAETGLRTDTNGTVFYVDPNAVGVSDQRDGTNPIEPLQTVATALTKCTAYANDVIVVSMNSAWEHGNQAVGRATPVREEVTVSVPGVKIVGLAPSSSLGVVWEPVTASGTMITVNAMDILIEGFCFHDDTLGLGNATAITAAWDAPPYGDNLTVRNCFFGEDLDYGITLDFSYYVDIHGNYFDNIQVAAIHNLDVAGDPDYARIHDNQFLDCTAAINLPGTGACAIYRNLIYGSGAGTNNFINLTGGASNTVCQNVMSCTLGAQYTATCTAGAGDAWIHNYLMNGVTTGNP